MVFEQQLYEMLKKPLAATGNLTLQYIFFFPRVESGVKGERKDNASSVVSPPVRADPRRARFTAALLN